MELVGRYTNHDSNVLGVNRGAQVTGVACAALFCPWVAVMARFYVRLGIQKIFGKEDWVTLASLIILTTLCGVLLGPVLHFGLGAHMRNISSTYLEELSKDIFICELLYVLTTALTKISIGLYFLRLTNKRPQTLFIYTVMTIVCFFSTVYLFFVLFQCSPVSHLWTQFGVGEGKCLSKKVIANVTYAHAAMSVVTDWAFGLLPIAFVWNLRLTGRTKASVILILSLGFFASTATIVRIIYIQRLESTTDYTWEGINLVKWSIIEPAIALTAAAFATLRPLFQKVTCCTARSSPKIYTSSSETDSDNNNKSGSRAQLARYSGDSYTSEFAAMLGLSRVGVTTTITADRRRSRNVDNGEKGSRRWLGRHRKGDSETELHAIESCDESIDWKGGIHTTTTVTRTIGKD